MPSGSPGKVTLSKLEKDIDKSVHFAYTKYNLRWRFPPAVVVAVSADVP